MKILFVVNPISGGVDKSTIISDVENLCEFHKFQFIVYILKRKDSQLIELAQDFRPDRIVIIGGDGTINFVVSTLHHLKINFAIIPMGSANGMAKELDLNSNHIESLVEAVFSNKIIYIDALLINDNLCLHLADIGTNSDLVAKFENEPERGLMSYAKHLFSTLRESTEKVFAINSNGKIFNWRGHMLTFANAAQYGSGIIINPGGVVDDSFFELCNIKNMSLESILSILFTSINSGLGSNQNIDQIRTKKATVETLDKYLLQIDGELIGDFNKFEVVLADYKIPFVISSN
jgi:diacylglycerol kinase (ATP)